MSGERLRQGVLHPVDLVERLGIRDGSRVLALQVPRMYMAALHAAVGSRGRLESTPPRGPAPRTEPYRGRPEPQRGGRPQRGPRGPRDYDRRAAPPRLRPGFDLAILWDDREHDFGDIAARVHDLLPEVVWLLVLRPGKRGAPGSMTLPEAQALLPGFEGERTVSLGDRYALLFRKIPPAPEPKA